MIWYNLLIFIKWVRRHWPFTSLVWMLLSSISSWQFPLVQFWCYQKRWYLSAPKFCMFLLIFMYLGIRLYRSSEHTNQRILFDIEPSGRHLGTGGQVILLLFIFCGGVEEQPISGFQAVSAINNDWLTFCFTSLCSRMV